MRCSLLLALIGCDDVRFGPVADTAAPIVAPVYADDIEPLWLDHCSGCHTDGGAQAGLALDGGAELLVDVPSSEAPGVLLVASGDPDASYLYLKLTDAQDGVGGSGSAMPPGAALSGAEIETVSNWIEGLATPGT